MVRNILFLGIVIVLLATSATAADLVVNGGFTTGDFSGWNNPTGAWFIGGVGSDPGAPTDTSFAASTACTGAGCNDAASGNTLSQTLNTVAGTTYVLTFYYDPGPHQGGVFGLTTELEVFWNGASVDTITNPTMDTWSQYSVAGLTASGTSTTLEFTGRADESSLFLTDVSVTAPEPMTLTLIGGGLLGLGALGTILRRRRKS